MVTASIVRRLLASILERFAGGEGCLCISNEKPSVSPRSAVVLTPGDIPTTEIYLKERLEKRFDGSVAYVNTLKRTPRLKEGQDAPLVVVVRYAPLRCLLWLLHERDRLARIAFLVDDDMPGALRTTDLPLGYAVKTAWRYALTKRFLQGRCDQLWVSTPELAERYPFDKAKACPPRCVYPLSRCGQHNVYFFHGTWSHRREIQWLLPIVRQVQRQAPDVWFEIMGTDRVRRLFRSVPRVRVVHPMPWTDYRKYVQNCSYRVGLAPCLESDFNRARSHSKIFDICAMGAVGVYSNALPYVGRVLHGRTGLLCDHTPETWTAAILLLLRDRELRASMFAKAREWCAQENCAGCPL